MHWNHEPTSNPSQEGKGHDADECVLPSREGSGVGRIMKRLVGNFASHRWHERRFHWSEADIQIHFKP